MNYYDRMNDILKIVKKIIKKICNFSNLYYYIIIYSHPVIIYNTLFLV